MAVNLGRRFWLLTFLFLFFYFSAFHQTRSEIVTITSNTFADKINQKDTVWFIKFFVPWCKYCKSLGTLWEDLASVVEKEDEIEIGEVDYTTDKPICTKVDIYSYPTFKAFYDGEEIAKYKGLKEVKSLQKFILEEADKATRSKVDDEDALDNNMHTYLLFSVKPKKVWNLRKIAVVVDLSHSCGWYARAK